MKIAVLSGKGGTGKTTVATSLALAVSSLNRSVSLLDCDVEAPNVANYFPNSEVVNRIEVTVKVPVVQEELCSGCGRCEEFCRFNAVLVLEKARILEDFCHTCGGCGLVCPAGAIVEEDRKVGEIILAVDRESGIELVLGRLDVGYPRAGVVISGVKAQPRGVIQVLDCPPGVGCSVIEALEGVDLALVVVEDSPSGVHDFLRLWELLEELDVRRELVWNKQGLEGGGLSRALARLSITPIFSLPYDEELLRSSIGGRAIFYLSDAWKKRFSDLAKKVLGVLG